MRSTAPALDTSSFLVALTAETAAKNQSFGSLAARLSALVANKVSIAPTIVLTPTAIEALFERNHFLPLLAHFLTNLQNDHRALQEVSTNLREAITSFSFPTQLADALQQTYVTQWQHAFLTLRPSYFHAQTETQEDVLPIQGESNLQESILEILARAYDTAMLLERHQEYIAGKRAPGSLLIQKLPNPLSGGVAFFPHPVTQDSHTVLVCGRPGAGCSPLNITDKLLQEMDCFEVSTRSWQIQRQLIQHKTQQYGYALDGFSRTPLKGVRQDTAVLTDAHVIALAKIAHTAQRTEGRPIALEWVRAPDPMILSIMPLSQHAVAQIRHTFVKPEKLPTPKERKTFSLVDADTIWQTLSAHPHHLLANHHKSSIAPAVLALCQTAMHGTPPGTQFLYRTHTFTTADWQQLHNGQAYEPTEQNPWLGYRGGIRVIHDPETLDFELAALNDAIDHAPQAWGVVLPFIRTSVEFALIKRRILNSPSASRLGQRLWLECDTPASLLEIHEFLPHHPAGLLLNIRSLAGCFFGVDPTNLDLTPHYPLDVPFFQHLLTQLKSHLVGTSLPVAVLLTAEEQALRTVIHQLEWEVIHRQGTHG